MLHSNPIESVSVKFEQQERGRKLHLENINKLDSQQAPLSDEVNIEPFHYFSITFEHESVLDTITLQITPTFQYIILRLFMFHLEAFQHECVFIQTPEKLFKLNKKGKI